MKNICDKNCIVINCENDCSEKDIPVTKEENKYVIRFRRFEAPKFTRDKDTEYE